MSCENAESDLGQSVEKIERKPEDALGRLALCFVLAFALLIGVGLALTAGGTHSPAVVQARAPDTGVDGAGTMTLSGTMEQDALQPVLDDFNTKTGINVVYGKVDTPAQLENCAASSSCPDAALVAWPGLLAQLGPTGTLVALDPFISSTLLISNYSDAWIDLGTVDGTLYGVFFNASNKSLVWHDPTEFVGHGWLTPTTWAELIALSDQISDTTGTPPWSIGAASGAASGWPITDWFEDILLRSAGPDVYDGLIDQSVAWTSTEVLMAVEYFGQIFGTEGYQLGGKEGTINTFFIDAMYPPFESPPEAYLHRQGAFAQLRISDHFPGLTAGVDYAIFPFPDIDPAYANSVLSAGDVAMAFTGTNDVQSFINYLITTGAAELWVQEGNMSPNREVDFNLYPDPNTRAAAENLVGADISRFDLTDQLPAELNNYIWSVMDDLVWAAPDPDAMESVLLRIENRAAGKQSVYLPVLAKEK